MSTTAFDTSREVVAFRVRVHTFVKLDPLSPEGKRVLRSRYPGNFAMIPTRANAERLRQYCVAERSEDFFFDTLEEALAFSDGKSNAFIGVKYVGNRNFSFIGRDGYLFAEPR